MIALYHKDAQQINDCTLREIIPKVNGLVEVEGRWHIEPLEPAIVNDFTIFSWVVIPEQTIIYPEYCYDDIDGHEFLVTMPKVGELNLVYYTEDELKGFVPLPGTGVPEKIEHIENFLTKMFPTRGI